MQKPQTIQEIQQNAQTNFAKNGFPTRKNEDYKYTDIQSFVKCSEHLLTEKIELKVSEIETLIINPTHYKLVFSNGFFFEELSNFPKDKMEVLSFSSEKNSEKIATIFNKIATISDEFVAQNTSHFQEGIYIAIKENAIIEHPIELIYINKTDEKKSFLPIRAIINLEKNSSVTFVSNFKNNYDNQLFTNIVTEILVSENANFNGYKLQNDNEFSTQIDATFITQHKNSNASVFTFSLGGNVNRNVLVFNQNGENCNSTLQGISIANQSQEIGNHTTINHNFPNCESHELYKGIYKDTSHGIFNGKVKVRANAQKINAYQQNNSLLLSETATLDTKPQLEIFADDVKCSHGCTIGQLDDEALFYLRSRGIELAQAKTLLTLAFASEIIENISIKELQKIVSELVTKKLQ